MARLAFEPLREFGLQDFERDEAVEPRIAGLPHLAHPARTDGREEFTGAEFFSDSHRHQATEARVVVCLSNWFRRRWIVFTSRSSK